MDALITWIEDSSQPEVSKLDLSCRRDKDVGSLYVPVNHMLFVKVLHAPQDLEHNALELGHFKGHLHVDEALQVVLQILED